MQLNSKIKEFFPESLIRLLAAVCDTRRIDSSHKKMKLIQQLLKKFEIPFQPLGGATNRLALMINGYTVKFALDRQGYKDNLMEYSLSIELQPYVTKTYETNGYIVVAECVKTMTRPEWSLYKSDILKILEILSTDYLLGDVGYIKKNFTNWGVRDDGSLVILDYAYCHRATENLFTCDVCGSGILRYDSTFTYLRCGNATVCNAKYNYTQRKLVQGNQVDLDLIDEAKASSLKVLPGETTVEVVDRNGTLMDGNIRIINTLPEYYEYLKRSEQKMFSLYNNQRLFDLNVEKINTTDPKRLKEIEKEIRAIVEEEKQFDEQNVEIREEVDWDEIERQIQEEEVYDEEPDVCDADYGTSLDDLIRQANKHQIHEEVEEKAEPLTVPIGEMVATNGTASGETQDTEKEAVELEQNSPQEDQVEGDGVFVNGQPVGDLT